MNDHPHIDPRPHRQRTFRARPITPAARRRRERERLKRKRRGWSYLLCERARNRARMRAVRARRKGAGDQIAVRQPATHQIPQ
jgi:hypothetical protein